MVRAQVPASTAPGTCRTTAALGASEFGVDAALLQRLIEEFGIEYRNVPVVASPQKQRRRPYLGNAQERRQPLVQSRVLPRDTQLPRVPLLVDVMAVVGHDQAVPGARGGGLESSGARDDRIGHVTAVRVAGHRKSLRIRDAKCYDVIDGGDHIVIVRDAP
jgi:hypothetical protein